MSILSDSELDKNLINLRLKGKLNKLVDRELDTLTSDPNSISQKYKSFSVYSTKQKSNNNILYNKDNVDYIKLSNNTQIKNSNNKYNNISTKFINKKQNDDVINNQLLKQQINEENKKLKDRLISCIDEANVISNSLKLSNRYRIVNDDINNVIIELYDHSTGVIRYNITIDMFYREYNRLVNKINLIKQIKPPKHTKSNIIQYNKTNNNDMVKESNRNWSDILDRYNQNHITYCSSEDMENSTTNGYDIKINKSLTQLEIDNQNQNNISNKLQNILLDTMIKCQHIDNQIQDIVQTKGWNRYSN